MSGSFNGQIFLDKLSKLNNSQQSIETLSHWCIFHRNKARQVVETWAQQFHNSPPDRRVSFLYLANDILQNSRRKGMEFITEFWRVLPEALNDVLENGDEFGRNAVTRLVNIWEDRKVFGSRGQTLKEELLGRKLDNRNRDGKGIAYKEKQPARQLWEKLISSYEHIQSTAMDDDALFGKCQNAINFVDKIEKEYGNNSDLGNNSESGVPREVQVQNNRLRECVEQLKATEFSRKALVSHLREVLHEEELKLERLHNQLQVVQARCERVDVLLGKQLSYNIRQPPPDQNKDLSSSLSNGPFNLKPESTTATGEKSQISPIVRGQEGPLNYNASSHAEGEVPKTAGGSMAAKLTASTTSAEKLTYSISSMSSDSIINQRTKKEYPDNNNKRPKLENSVPSYVLPPCPQPQSQPPPPPPPPPFPHPDSLQQPPPPPSSPPMDQSGPSLQPHPPTPLPLMPPLPPPTSTQFMPTAAGAMTGMPYSYMPSPFPPHPNFPMVSMPPFHGAPTPYQNFPVSEGGLFSQPPFPVPPPPMTKQ